LLLVDDQREVRSVLRLTFTSPDLVVEEAGNLEEASAAFRAHRPDAVLLDLDLDGADGWEVLIQLQDAYPDSAPPILILTADTSESASAKARELGAADLVTKPFRPLALMQTVHRLLRYGRA
jgi:DNA-binding response OmpR family regulator